MLVTGYPILNEKIICHKYAVINITEILNKLGIYFSTLDLTTKTGFSIDGDGYEFVRMPFGLIHFLKGLFHHIARRLNKFKQSISKIKESQFN